MSNVVLITFSRWNSSVEEEKKRKEGRIEGRKREKEKGSPLLTLAPSKGDSPDHTRLENATHPLDTCSPLENASLAVPPAALLMRLSEVLLLHLLSSLAATATTTTTSTASPTPQPPG